MQSDHRLTRDNVAVLQQGLELIAALDDRLYADPAPPLSPYGVGAHFRHCLDAYDCFLRGVASGRVNYDRRERDDSVAGNRLVALRKIAEITGALQTLQAAAAAPLLVLLEGAGEAEEAWSHSTVRRELQFLLSHTIHHYALIAMLLRHRGFEPAAEFGVAPSTLAYWREASACVR